MHWRKQLQRPSQKRTAITPQTQVFAQTGHWRKIGGRRIS